MIFTPRLADFVMRGEKTVTRRVAVENPNSPWWIGGCKLTPGRDYAVCPGRSKHQLGRVVVRSIEKQTLGQAFGTCDADAPADADAEARLEGFATAADMRAGFAEINSGYDPATVVWRIQFDPPERAAG